jgi:RHS repeat-associated protein
MIKQYGAGLYPIEFTSSPFGQTLEFKDGNNSATAFEYDIAGHLIKKIYADGSEIAYTYNAKGLLASKQEANRTSNYSYDKLNRLISITLTQGRASSITTFKYNRIDQLTKAIRDGISVFYDYDKFSRLVAEKQPNGKLAHEYNKYGLLKTKTASFSGKSSTWDSFLGVFGGTPKDTGPKFKTEYTYDKVDRLVSLSSSAGGSDSQLVVFSYDKKGRLKSKIIPNTAQVNFSYDKADRLLSKTLSTGGSESNIVKYTYDKLNRRTKATILDTAWNYGYDNRDQVIKAVATGSAAPNKYLYRYDKIGNRLKYATAPPQEKTLYTSNNLNQYTEISTNGTSYSPSYDIFGNCTNAVLNNSTWQMTWNLNNRLVSAQSADGKVEFSYDANGRRVEKKVFNQNGKLKKHIKFLYSGFKCVAEIDGKTGKVIHAYTWVGEQILGAYAPKNKKSLSYLTDGNKNVIGLIDEKGKFKAKYMYDPFGKLLKSQGPSANENPFRFSSEYHDQETGLVYYNYRYYSAELGRWLSRDSIEELGGYNLYAMVGNDPVNSWDYLGLKCEAEAQALLDAITDQTIAFGILLGAIKTKKPLAIKVAAALYALAATRAVRAMLFFNICMNADYEQPANDPWPDPNEDCKLGEYRSSEVPATCKCTKNEKTCYKNVTKEMFFVCKEVDVPNVIVIGPFSEELEGTKKANRWRPAPASWQGKPKCSKGYTPCQ